MDINKAWEILKRSIQENLKYIKIKTTKKVKDNITDKKIQTYRKMIKCLKDIRRDNKKLQYILENSQKKKVYYLTKIKRMKSIKEYNK